MLSHSFIKNTFGLPFLLFFCSNGSGIIHRLYFLCFLIPSSEYMEYVLWRHSSLLSFVTSQVISYLLISIPIRWLRRIIKLVSNVRLYFLTMLFSPLHFYYYILIIPLLSLSFHQILFIKFLQSFSCFHFLLPFSFPYFRYLRWCSYICMSLWPYQICVQKSSSDSRGSYLYHKRQTR